MPDKRKIVILSAFYDPYIVGGAEKQAKEILERLGNQHNMILVTARLRKDLLKQEEKKNYQVIRVGIGHEKIDKFIYPILAAFKTKNLKPDIAHAIMESYAGGALAVLKYIYPEAKRILSLQSGDLDDERKQKQFFIKLFWKIIHISPQKITAISSFLKKRAIRLGAKEKNVFVIPNGVDLSRVPASEGKIKGRVCSVARLSWEKGLNFLLDAWPAVLEKNKRAKLILVSKGEMREALEKQARELKIEDSVEFKGALPNEEALREIQKAEVFICPSLAEGLGNVFIEAQACGTPPIGTRVGGIPDVIEDKVNGLLIEPKNSKEIAQAINWLLSDSELRERLASKGRETVKKFDWQEVINKINQIY